LQWRRVRRALDPLRDELVREAQRHFGEIGLEEAWAEFFLFDGAGPFDRNSRFVPLFFSWYLYDWLPDPHGTELPAALHDITVAAAYLARTGHRLDPIARRYVETCIATPYSFHEVMDCRRGAGFRLRDVMLGTEVEVTERTASKSVQVGDVLFGKLVSIDGLVLIEGVGPTAIPPGHKSALIELRKTLGTRQGLFGGETLHEFADELRDLYLDIDEALHALPELRNTDDDPLELHTLIFDLDAPEAALERLEDLGGGFATTQIARDGAGRLLRADITWAGAGNKVNNEWDNTTLGTLRIEGTRLTAEINSAKRAAALRKLIERRLGDSARVRPSAVQSVQSLLEREPARPALREQREREQAALAAEPAVQAALRDMLGRHYRSWIDEKLPALGNRTPRNAVRDPDGREAVEALLTQIERDTARMNPGLDLEFVRELRVTLGLS
jgi:hypothetical protein